MVEMQRGWRAGYNSPIVGQIDGLRHFVGCSLWSPVSTWSNFVDSGRCQGVRRSTMVGSGRGGRAASARPLFVKIGSAGNIMGFVRLRGNSEIDDGRIGERSHEYYTSHK